MWAMRALLKAIWAPLKGYAFFHHSADEAADWADEAADWADEAADSADEAADSADEAADWADALR